MSTSSCECWLIIEKGQNPWGALRVARLSKKKPSTGPRQIAVKVGLSLPDALFAEPQVTARIAIADDKAPEKITAETVAGIESVLQNAGFVVRVVADEAQP
jgi:hypothetical protein